MFGSNDTEKETFEVGDVVQLKSESFNMTIIDIINNQADCVWGNDECQVFQRLFPLKALDKQ